MDEHLTDVERLMLQMKGVLPRLLFVVAGPSGVGKNTIIKELLTNHPREMSRLITYTTRPRREDEIEGEQYHFVNVEQFHDLALQGKLMEADADTAGHDVYKLGHVYSMPADIYEGMPRDKHLLVAEVDIHGMRLLRKHYPECITIFVTAPPADLVERIRERRDEHMNAASIAQRLEIAREQMAAANEFNYVIFNKEGRLFDTIRSIERIIQVERMRVRDGFDLQAAIPQDEFHTAVDSA